MTTAVTHEYETFHSWLCENGFRTMWQHKGPKGGHIKYISCYMAGNGRCILTYQYNDASDGWDYFIQSAHHKTADCLTELSELTKTAVAA